MSEQGYYAASAGGAAPLPDGAAQSAPISASWRPGYTGPLGALHAVRAGAKVVLVEARTSARRLGPHGGAIHPGTARTRRNLERWLGPAMPRLWPPQRGGRALIFDLARDGCELKRGLVIAAHSACRARPRRRGRVPPRTTPMANCACSIRPDPSFTGTDVYPRRGWIAAAAIVHPRKFARRLAGEALAAGALLFEHSPAARLGDGATPACNATAARYRRSCRAACDAFVPALAPARRRTSPVESFIVATAALGEALNERSSPAMSRSPTRAMCSTITAKAPTGACCSPAARAYWNRPPTSLRLVRPRLQRVFPALAPADRLCRRARSASTRTRMPHFGSSAAHFLGHCYSGHGVALTMVGAKHGRGCARPSGTLRYLRASHAKIPGGRMLRSRW